MGGIGSRDGKGRKPPPRIHRLAWIQSQNHPKSCCGSSRLAGLTRPPEPNWVARRCGGCTAEAWRCRLFGLSSAQPPFPHRRSTPAMGLQRPCPLYETWTLRTEATSYISPLAAAVALWWDTPIQRNSSLVPRLLHCLGQPSGCASRGRDAKAVLGASRGQDLEGWLAGLQGTASQRVGQCRACIGGIVCDAESTYARWGVGRADCPARSMSERGCCTKTAARREQAGRRRWASAGAGRGAYTLCQEENGTRRETHKPEVCCSCGGWLRRWMS